jgi:hypothetical protein
MGLNPPIGPVISVVEPVLPLAEFRQLSPKVTTGT